MNIVREESRVELEGPPAFEYGEKVRCLKYVRNDGTFAGKEIGEILVHKGDIGYVVSIGTYLQQFYIYGVDFFSRGHVVGMKERELDWLDEPDDGRAEG